MSSKLAPISLIGAVIGTTGTIDFNQFPKFAPNDMTKKAAIRILNESGCGLDTTFVASGNYHFLPAGAWGTFEVQPNDGSINIAVTYILPNPPVSMVQAIYYAPGEEIPQSFTLGNSPIGIGGSIAVGNTSLSNEGNPINTLVVDMGPIGNLNIVQLWNDHFVWSVVQGGVAHQIMKGQIAGNPLQLGQTGDIVEILGSLTVDQNAVITGTVSMGSLTLTNGGLVTGGDWNLGPHGITASGIIVATTLQTGSINEAGGANSWASVTNGGPTRIQSTGAGQAIALQVPGGTTVFSVGAGQMALAAGCNFKLANGNTIQGISSFTGAAGGTFNHLYGSAPFFVIPTTDVVGSQTMGYDTVTSTQVHITIGAALGFKVMCFG